MRSSLLRQRLLKTLLTLPPATLRFLAGGGVVYRDGRTLDPQIQFLWRGYFSKGDATPLSLQGKSIEQARQEWAETVALLGVPPQVRVRIEEITSETVRGLHIGRRPAACLLPSGRQCPGRARTVTSVLRGAGTRSPLPDLHSRPAHGACPSFSRRL
jgi:hypothetical protein